MSKNFKVEEKSNEHNESVLSLPSFRSYELDSLLHIECTIYRVTNGFPLAVELQRSSTIPCVYSVTDPDTAKKGVPSTKVSHRMRFADIAYSHLFWTRWKDFNNKDDTGVRRTNGREYLKRSRGMNVWVVKGLR